MQNKYIMTILISTLLSGCSAFDNNHGLIGEVVLARSHPLMRLQRQGITDSTNADGMVCQDASGKGMLFIFDDNGVLKGHKSLQN